MKQDGDFFGDQDVALIYIAKKLREALRLEGLLTEAGVDYAVEPDKYKGGVIFSAERIGAFFYVLPEAVEIARAVMERHGFRLLSDSGARGGPSASASPS
jgi:hypothetical protein